MRKSKLSLICAMVIFGTIGLVRRHIDLPSSFIALTRAVVGAAFLLGILALRRQKPDFAGIRQNALPLLLLSGVLLGFNWVFLFESYRFTDIATATLCYYMAPVLVILASPLLKEKLSAKKLLCVAVALVGAVLVSGVADSGFQLDNGTGILFGLAAALFYACVMLLNKKISLPSAYDKTIVQLTAAAVVLIPYVLLTEDVSAISFSPLSACLLLTAGVVHTGIAYALYFGAMGRLPAQTVALYSYIDPVLAILVSALLLHEPMTPLSAVGAVLILGAAFASEK